MYVYTHDSREVSVHVHCVVVCFYVELTTSLGLALAMLTTRNVLSVTLSYNLHIIRDYHNYRWMCVLYRGW